MPLQLSNADVEALRRLRRSSFAPALRAVMHKLLDNNRRVYEATHASEANRVVLDDTKTAMHLLFDKEL